MDLVDFSEEVFEEIRETYIDAAAKLGVADLTFIPVSALLGDNIVDKSANTPWYDGPTLLHHLETVPVGSTRNLVDFRFPVQYVLRPDQDFRGYAGRIATGTVTPGEKVVALPSGERSRVRSVETMDGPLDEAVAGQAVVVTLEDEIDLSRGEMVARTNNLPVVGDRFDAMVCWMAEEPMDPSRPYVLMHTTREAQAYVTRLHYRIDMDTLHRQEAETLELNDIGRIEVMASRPLFFDPYERNRETGGFILVDPATQVTVAAGIIRGEVRTAEAVFQSGRKDRLGSQNLVWEEWNIPLSEREERAGHGAGVVWLTGLSGSGKSTIGRELERRLFEDGVRSMLLDGDQVRHGLCAHLGFSAEDRAENIRRVAEVARLFFEAGHMVICTFVSPFRRDREFARQLVPDGRFLEVFVDTPLEVCKERDPKGLYAKAEAGEIRDMTGISSPYEAPESAEMVIDTARSAPGDAVAALVDALKERGLLP